MGAWVKQVSQGRQSWSHAYCLPGVDDLGGAVPLEGLGVSGETSSVLHGGGVGAEVRNETSKDKPSIARLERHSIFDQNT